MDLYLNGGDPLSLSLQDMLDCDIKTEVDSVLAGDLSLGDLPSFDMDEESLGSHMWFSNNGLHNANSNSSNSNFNLDFVGGDAAAMMVNPNSVMPLTLMTSHNPIVEATSTDADVSTDVDSPESSPSTSPPAPSYIRAVSATSTAAVLPPRSVSSYQNGQQRTVPTMIRIAAKPSQIASSTTSPYAPTIVTSSTKTVPIITHSAKLQKQLQQLTNGGGAGVSALPRTIHIHQKIHQNQIQQHSVQTLPPQTKKQFHINNNKHYVEMEFDDRSYPKPAYSYSCLIAMALKNSKTGSLPVSDIYSFMCEHFPYFKTAPSGWKNSVRHNLSLNKCFEKIEKPSGNGSQRKGCLWAMNPAKITKMDDEVQKWSRKDPMAIKKAMVYPENLEMLERGEMKMTSRSELEVMGNGDDTETSEDGDADADNDTDVDMDGDLDEGVAPNQEDEEDDDDEVESEGEEDADVDPTSTTTGLTTFPADFIMDNIADSFDESSLTELDIEVADGIYEELDFNEAKKLNLVDLKRSAAQSSIGASRGARRTHSDPDQQDGYDFGLDEDDHEDEPPTSRSRIQGNYIYKPVVSIDGSFTTTSTSRRKQPLLVRSSSASVVKVENR